MTLFPKYHIILCILNHLLPYHLFLTMWVGEFNAYTFFVFVLIFFLKYVLILNLTLFFIWISSHLNHFLFPYTLRSAGCWYNLHYYYLLILFFTRKDYLFIENSFILIILLLLLLSYVHSSFLIQLFEFYNLWFSKIRHLHTISRKKKEWKKWVYK